MAAQKRLFVLSGLLIMILISAGCLGGWSQTSWQVPIAIRLLEESITTQDILGNLSDAELDVSEGEPVALRVEDAFVLEPDVTLSIPDFDATGTYPNVLVDSLNSSELTEESTVFVEVSLADLFEVEDFTLQSLTVNSARFDVTLKDTDAEVGPATDSKRRIVAVYLRTDSHEVDVWDSQEQAVFLDGRTVYPESELVLAINVSDRTEAFVWEVTGQNLTPAAANASFEEVLALDIEPIELGFGGSDQLQPLFEAISAIDIDMSFVLNNATGAEISGFDTLELHFVGSETEILEITETFIDESDTVTTITIPSGVLWPYIKGLPDTVEVVGQLTIGGSDQELSFTANQLDGVVDGFTTFSLSMEFTADFSEVEPFLTDAAEVTADPASVDDMDELGELVLFVEAANQLPVGVELFLDVSSDEAFSSINTDYLEVGTIPPTGQSDTLALPVDETLKNLLRNGGYLRARLVISGDGKMVVRGDDTVRIRVWVETRMNVSFDSDSDT